MMDPNNNNSNNDNNNVLLLLAAITQHQQINLLEILFSINHDPSAEALELIAQRINSTSQNVASWFENRRQQFQAQQAAAAAAAISAGGNHLNLVLNNLMLDPQQLQHHLQQQQNNNHLNHNHHHNHHGNNQQLHSALLDCIAAAPSSLTANISNSSQYYYDYPLSNASSSPTTTQQPIQLSALNATRNSVDSPPDHIQNNSSNHNHNHHHHHHHHNPHQIQDNSQASSTLLAKLTAVTSGLAGSPAVAGVAPPPPSHNHVLAGNGNVKLDSKMIDLLEALYAINDNPEMAAIEMISKRVDVPCHLISDWFDKKRMKLNPFAGHRSPPINKKREGGRVVTFSEYQRSLLEAIFNENNYLHPQEYEELSKLIQVPSRNIKIWFKNRRSKQRLSSGARTNSVRCDNDSIEQEQEQQLNLHQHHH